MADETTDAAEVREAASALNDAANKIESAEAAIEAAEEAEEEAREVQEALAQAALEGERGKRIANIETEIASWPEKLMAAITLALVPVTERLTTMEAKVNAQTPPEVKVEVTPPANPEATQSTPPASPPEVTVTVADPEKVSADVPPVPEGKKKRRWL